jgi:hypothetical protein
LITEFSGTLLFIEVRCSLFKTRRNGVKQVVNSGAVPPQNLDSKSSAGEMSRKPTVLVATTSRWYPTARLAMALAKAGCAVEFVCPPGHPFMKTRGRSRSHIYDGFAPLSSFGAAIASARPDMIIPGDDLATQILHEIHDGNLRLGESGRSVCALIERSLGAAPSFAITRSRAGFIKLAQELGVRVPATESIASARDLTDWIGRNGLPAVLKADGTSGGAGVRLARTADEAESAFHALQAPPSFLRAAKQALLDHDVSLVGPAFRRRRFEMNVQAFVAGQEATSAVACWEGKVLAALHFKVINKTSLSGPSTVVRWIENVEMADAAQKLARRLNLSGLHGFDYMLEEHTGNPYLIEINPRATQVGHLALGPGRDIPAAFYAALSNTSVESSRVTERDTVALFPQEWLRDPESEFLRAAYHDVPWEEPDLIRDCVQKRRRQRAWLRWVSSRERSKAVRSTKPAKAAAQSHS